MDASCDGRAPRAALSIEANFSWSLAGNVVYAGCQWAMLIVLAKLCAPQSLGVFALGLAVAAPVMMLTNLQLRGVQATDARGEYSFAQYLGVRLVSTALALAAIAAAALSIGAGGAVILAIGAAKAVESISDLVYGLFQAHQTLDLSAKSMLLRGPLSLAVFAACLLLTHDVLAGALGLFAAWATVLFTYDLPRAAALVGWRGLRPALDRVTSARLVRTALPLGVVMMLGSLSINIPRYFVEHALGPRQLGIFAALTSLIVAGTTVVGALGQSASPLLAVRFARGDRRGFLRLTRGLLGIGAGLGAAGVLVAAAAGGPLLRLLFTAEYGAEARAFVAIMAVAAVGYLASFLGYAMTAARKFDAQTPLSLAASAATLLLSALLVPRFHLLGAAWAMGGAVVVQLAGGAFICARALDELRSGEAR